MTAIRIDTLRNEIAGARELLDMIHQELEDLHVLAYERATTLSEAKVSGGSHDYALDTHGDPRARDAYKHLGKAVDGACILLAEASNNALNLLRQGDTPGRGQRHLRLAELGEAVAAQAKRSRRGDYTAIRRGPQPELAKATEQLQKERDDAIRERDAARRQRDKAVADLSNLRAKRPAWWKGSSTS